MMESLLEPIDRDSPCGPNLEYDADFLLLQECASGKSEQQYGDTLIAAEPPDWTRVEQIATSLLARTKDLRVVTELTRAWMQADGFMGLARGTKLAAALLETYWDEVHPALVDDDRSDPMPRVNVLRELAGANGCPQAVRDCPLLAGMNARVVAGALVRGRSDGPHSPDAGARIVDDLRAARAGGDRALASALDVLDALRAVREIVRARLGDEWSIEASAIERDLSIVADSLAAADGDAASPARHEERASSERAFEPAPSASGQSIAIGSRAEVERCLDALCRYFEQYEPSHPAPLLLRRVRRLLTLDFYEIVRDIAPDGLRQLELLSGHGADGEGTGT